MSEELTKEGLDELEKLLRGACGGPLKPFVPELRHLLSMARRALEVEERLERIHKSVCEDMCDGAYHRDYGSGFFASQDVIDSLLELSSGRPKAIRPPAQCAPPEVPDVPPDKDQVCSHGVPIGYVCPECDAEAMRKGLDDHSCNSTGWGKP